MLLVAPETTAVAGEEGLQDSDDEDDEDAEV